MPGKYSRKEYLKMARKHLIDQYRNNKPLAILCLNNFGGIVLLHCDGDNVVSGYDFGQGVTDIRINKIEYTCKGLPYFRKNGTRYLLKDFMLI